MQAAHHVVIVDAFHDWDDGFAVERRIWDRHGITATVLNCDTEDGIVAAAEGADALVNMGLSTPLTGRVIRALPRCRVIARYGVGVDNIDLVAATEEGIVVTNVPNYCTPEVADHTVTLILALARRLLSLDRFVRSGRWVGSIQFTGPIHRLSTLTLGLVGFGRIAQEVARRMEALVGDIVAYDPYVDPDRAAGLGVEPVDLNTLLARSDVVSLHVPLNSNTHHLIGESELERMKPTAFLVNTSRGQVVDEGALIAALESERIAGAALDVVAIEPLPTESPLRALPNVILTPHFANYSVEAVRDLRESVACAVCDVLAGRWPAHVVNGDVEPRIPLESV